MHYFEDFEVGYCEHSEQSYRVTEDNIIEFAKQWDPLPFHVDPEAAKGSPLGQIIASGVHTMAIGIRLLRTLELEPVAYVAGIGWDNAQLKAPVLPGHELKLKMTVTDKRRSQSKPDRGIIVTDQAIYNHHDQEVLTYQLTFMVLTRPT